MLLERFICWARGHNWKYNTEKIDQGTNRVCSRCGAWEICYYKSLLGRVFWVNAK